MAAWNLIDMERPWQYKQDAQVYFCGTDKRVFWNAYIFTANKEFWEKTSELAREKAWAMLSEEERDQESVTNFVPSEYDAWGYPTSFSWERKTYRYPQFGDLTYRDYKTKIEAEIIVNKPLEVYENFKVDRQFEADIGLYVVVDADYIDREVVERVIDRFFEVGETDWQSYTPVPRDRLPCETEMVFLYDGSAGKTVRHRGSEELEQMLNSHPRRESMMQMFSKKEGLQIK